MMRLDGPYPMPLRFDICFGRQYTRGIVFYRMEGHGHLDHLTTLVLEYRP
jgi:hypothetical protein